MTLFFAVVTIFDRDGRVIEAGNSVKESQFAPESFERYLRKGAVISRDPLADMAEDQNARDPEKGFEYPKPWSFPPEELKDAGLDALNLLIMDTAEQNGIQNPPTFEKVEDAIAFLGSDLT